MSSVTIATQIIDHACRKLAVAVDSIGNGAAPVWELGIEETLAEGDMMFTAGFIVVALGLFLLIVGLCTLDRSGASDFLMAAGAVLLIIGLIVGVRGKRRCIAPNKTLAREVMGRMPR